MAMEAYRVIWRGQKAPDQDLTEGQLEEELREEMQNNKEPNHAINRRLKRQFHAAMQRRFGLMAAWLYLEWGLIDEAILGAMADAQRDRKEDIPVHGGTPVSAESVAATHEASQARRRVKNMENQDTRWEAANQEGGLCEAEHCDCPQWWSRRRTRCLHCSRKVGECCQASVGGTGTSEPITWHLVCKPCGAREGLGAPTLRAIDPNLPRSANCAYHLTHQTASVNQCYLCFRWLCTSCCKPDGPPHECRSCPEAF